MFILLVEVSQQDATLLDIHNLFRLFPPPRLFDTLLASPLLSGAPNSTWATFLYLFYNFAVYTAPSVTGDVAVSLHWLTIPPHFDSPHLCHLPSLAGAQRGILQTLSSHSGIPLSSPHNLQPNWNRIRTMLSGEPSPDEGIHMASSLSSPVGRYILESIAANLPYPFPAHVSVILELFHRFVSVSDAVRMDLVRNGVLDSVVFAVSCSSFLDDYEKGVAVIGILLDTIRRDHQKRTIRNVDFSHLF
ncbi:hypothetical protein BLNAU_21128 [Blattamonas nauphoetae]|uniref:Uncharacterized protein n=1 Tax=Blattamonas nauphoetae TaxID=2049346 RepID=A0ABQ9WWT6_9EUKA|nr:hypothetical protein BLNAU_21128 [Blattamonas nauphoetae]